MTAAHLWHLLPINISRGISRSTLLSNDDIRAASSSSGVGTRSELNVENLINQLTRSIVWEEWKLRKIFQLIPIDCRPKSLRLSTLLRDICDLIVFHHFHSLSGGGCDSQWNALTINIEQMTDVVL